MRRANTTFVAGCTRIRSLEHAIIDAAASRRMSDTSTQLDLWFLASQMLKSGRVGWSSSVAAGAWMFLITLNANTSSRKLQRGCKIIMKYIHGQCQITSLQIFHLQGCSMLVTEQAGSCAYIPTAVAVTLLSRDSVCHQSSSQPEPHSFAATHKVPIPAQLIADEVQQH